MKIRVTKNFGGYRVGQVFDWGDGMARIYIGRGMVEAVRGETPAIEEATVSVATERAVSPVRRKQK